MQEIGVDTSTLLLAFGLTLFAGLSTGVGSIVAFFSSDQNHRFLSGALGFSAGVMLYVSMVEIFGKAQDSLAVSVGEPRALHLATLAFFVGIALIAIIDRFIPTMQNPHEVRGIDEIADETEAELKKRRNLLRMGLFSALAIALHNFPEGLATFIATLEDPALGVSIAIAIAIHNVPEGIAVSVPIYHATGSRRKALRLSFLSGLAEPVGAVIGYLLLSPFMNDMVFGLLFAGVAGIMVFISLDELLPTAEHYGEHHITIYGLIAGMVVMALSIVMMA
ncbi:MAG: zinc transporter ZupT [Spirochaetota bacterium]